MVKKKEDEKGAAAARRRSRGMAKGKEQSDGRREERANMCTPYYVLASTNILYVCMYKSRRGSV